MAVATMDHSFLVAANSRLANACAKCGRTRDAHPVLEKSGKRDPMFERDFLNEAERLAGLSSGGFAEQVHDRLQRAERELGQDSYLQHSMGRLLAEIGEEGLDVAGWSCVAALASFEKVADDDERGELLLLLQQIASYGPLVWRMVQRAHDLLS